MNNGQVDTLNIADTNLNNTDKNNIPQKTKLWLEENLIPKLKTAINEENSTAEYKVISDSPLIMSSLIFMELSLTSGKCVKKMSLVIKRPIQDDFLRNLFLSDYNFHNEILFYETYAKNCEDFPRCFYTLEEPPYNSVIVVENINEHGYHVCPQKVNVDMKYIVAAMQEIGRFHARAYTLRDKSPEKFFQIVSNIKESRYKHKENDFFAVMINSLMPRVIKRLREQNYDKVFCERAEKFFSNAFDNIMKAAFKPKSKTIATLCHGDFTISNIFFKESESEMKAMIFDFALIGYGSPAVDLSTFIYLSMSAEDIRTRFSEIFDVYYNSLWSCLKKAELTNLNEFSKEAFLSDYKRHALFGYMIASFYLPVMYDVEIPRVKSMATMTTEEVARSFENIGGDRFGDLFTEMFLDLKNSGCLDHIL